MSGYEPGTVAVATVRGVQGVRVMRASDSDWLTAGIVAGYRWHGDQHLADVRPLVVLDIPSIIRGVDERMAFVKFLRRSSAQDSTNWRIADQIEAQVRLPKPDEPTGLGAVVKDRSGLTWVRRHPGGKAWVNGYQRWASYDDINPVEVLSPGVTP